MPNALYNKGRQKFLEGGISWLTDTIKVVFIDSGLYSLDLVLDEFLTDIPGSAQVHISSQLAGKTADGGIADADDLQADGVAGASIEALALFKDTGIAATSPLIAYMDSVDGLPFTPGGDNLRIVWDNGSNRIFVL